MSTWSEEISFTPKHEHQSIITRFFDEASQIFKGYTLFNLAFILIAACEIVGCLVFYNLIMRSALLAFTLAGLILTLFCYFILRIYFQNKRPEQLLELSESIFEELQEAATSKPEKVERYLWIGSSLCHLAHNLKDFEYTLYKPKKNFQTLSYSLEKLGAWLHWSDVHALKEWLYFQAVECYVELIKLEPHNLQFHVALANTYIMLSSIYALPKRPDSSEEERWISPEKFSKAMEQKFTTCAKRAIEEFKILNDYHPNDPWVYTQLAYSYHDLQMPAEEIKAYETILKLSPEDTEALYKLGILYFQQGLNSKGLKVYEKVKTRTPQKAESLIRYYGAYSDEDALEDY